MSRRLSVPEALSRLGGGACGTLFGQNQIPIPTLDFQGPEVHAERFEIFGI